MIKINLLPTEFRLVEVKKSRFSPQSILILALIGFSVITLFQFFGYANVRGKLHGLKSEMAQVAQPSKEADELMQTISMKLEPQKNFLNQHVISNFFLAEIMNSLSDVLPDSIWFSDMTMKRNRDDFRLDLSGYSQITSKQIAVAQIQEYVNSIKSKLEGIINAALSEKQSKEKPREVKVILTTNMREVSGVEAMQFAVSFQAGSGDVK